MQCEINENGVCLNPKEVMRFTYQKEVLLKIFAAPYQCKFISSYQYECTDGGGGSPCLTDSANFHETERDAILFELRKAKRIISSHTQKGKTIALLQFIDSELNKQQISLF